MYRPDKYTGKTKAVIDLATQKMLSGDSMRGINALLKAAQDIKRASRSKKKAAPTQTRSQPRRASQGQFPKKRYITRGYRGSKMKKPKRFKHDFYAKSGSITKIETGGVVSDTNCVYVGFGTNPISYTHRAICRAIVKEIMSQAGHSIGRFDDRFNSSGFVYNLRFRYLTDPSDDVINETVVAIPNNPLYETVAIDVAAQMVTLYQANPHMFIEEIALVETIVSLGTAKVVGEICCGNFGLYIKSIGSISIQNRTLSSDGAATFTDISNNPVHGKTYAGVGNHFKVRNFVDQTLNTPFYVPGLNPAFGVASQENQSVVSRKPLNPQDLSGVRKSGSVTISPGEIRHGYLSYFKKINLKTFYRDYHETLVDPTMETHKLGKIYMVGLEKMVNDRIAEPNVSIGYEVNLTLKVAGIYRRKIETVASIVEIP